jgi:simple sugar transport system ATP-binding protein
VTEHLPALALEHIDKRFGAVTALNGANLFVRPGTVHAVLGENGAGKTTLMRVAYGMTMPDRGVVRIRGRAVQLRSPADAIGLGIGMVHQHFTLVPAMTVAENLALGAYGTFHSRATATALEDLTRQTGMSLDSEARVGDLSVTEQQRLELLKVLSRRADILILDEPTAVLAPAEADVLLRRLRGLADAGRAVILITHKLREALSIADEVTVLRHGTCTLTSPRAGVDEDQLVEAMLGRRSQIPTVPTTRSPTPGRTVIAAHDVSIVDSRGTARVRNATFEVRSGEIVGVAAVDGSGHRELLRAIAGRLPVASGTLSLPASVGFVPDDRHRDGLVLPMSLAENYALRGAGQRRGVIRWREEASAAKQIIQDFNVRTEGVDMPAGALSGGNQQRFILGRELHGPPAAIVVENASRGLDVQASMYVRDRLTDACSKGVAIVMYSSDLDEILAIAHRVLVVYVGAVREVAVDVDLVGRAMLGAA